MKNLLLAAGLLFLAASVFGQNKIKGTVYEASTGEPLYGAYITISETKGAVSDFNGSFELTVEDGDYVLTVSFVGLENQTIPVSINGSDRTLKIELETAVLKEVEIVADYAIDRQTPVAFSNVDRKMIEEDLASQDIPMLLNSTPGVQATQQGGGDGDARITIRGFNQEDIAVMIDGIPVNDMENGAVYWSNWSGLDVVTKTVQVQRGLGASKLAIPSVGGTLNMITKGIDAKPGLTIKNEVGTGAYFRTSVGYTSGRTEKGWGVTLAGSFRRTDGWADNVWGRGGFYFMRVDKSIGNHMISVIGSGGPQTHAQRAFKLPIHAYDKQYAKELGVDTTNTYEYGYRYNQYWGYLERRDLTKLDNGSFDTIPDIREVQSERINRYHKPQVSIRHSWDINDRMYLSNIAYVSNGRGGGIRPNTSLIRINSGENRGQVNLQRFWDQNQLLINNGQEQSTRVFEIARNDHLWIGLLSTFNYKIKENLRFTTGLDLRTYRGFHTTEIYDLFGGDYFYNPSESSPFIDPDNQNQTEGDPIARDYDGQVRWAGTFGQFEYKKDNKWSAFFSASTALSAYNRIDRFNVPMDLVLEDTTIVQVLGPRNNQPANAVETFVYEGKEYTWESPEAQFSETGWQNLVGYTLKTGFNYNINRHHNAFVNVGFLKRTPHLDNVINFNLNAPVRKIRTEDILAFELGYGLRYPKFALNLNTYYTNWANIPYAINIPIDGEQVRYNLNEFSRLHRGVEVDFSYKITNYLSVEGVISFGDWRWTSGDSVNYAELEPDADQGAFVFDADGIHTGDAAQSQLAGMLRIEPLKNLYFKPRFTWYGRYWADFQAQDLTRRVSSSGTVFDNRGRESWRIPDYYQIDFHAGYSFNVNQYRVSITGSILNITNNFYISDAQNNDSFASSNQDFDANSASVFFSQGIRWVVGVKFQMNDFKKKEQP